MLTRNCFRSACSHAQRYAYSTTASSPSIAQLLQSPPSTTSVVTIDCFIRSIRKQKTRAFAALGDGSSLAPLQALLAPSQAEQLSIGTAVRLTGHWKESPNASIQSHELHVNAVDIIGHSDPSTFPLQKKYQTNEYLRTLPHLRPRVPLNSLLLRLRSQSISHLTQFFEKRDFTQTHPPIITSSDCEGAGEVFTVDTSDTADSSQASAVGEQQQQQQQPHQPPPPPTDRPHPQPQHFFKSPKYLTVSSQLHLESLAQAVGRVWTLSPTFRAERSETARHLSEFYMLEAEVNFAPGLAAIMDLVEDMLRHVATEMFETPVTRELLYGRRPGESGAGGGGSATGTQTETQTETGPRAGAPPPLEARWQGLMRPGWPRITYARAVEMLRASGQAFEHEPALGRALQAEHERYIAREVGGGSPVFVTRYPRDIKPFYMLPSGARADAGASSSSAAAVGAAGAEGERGWEGRGRGRGGVELETVECFDLLVPEACEIAGGSMREHRLENLVESMRRHGLVPKRSSGSGSSSGSSSGAASGQQQEEDNLGQLQWYVDLRRWGSAPHGGFGLGFDRFLAYLAGVPNIRDVVAFPRWVGRCDC